MDTDNFVKETFYFQVEQILILTGETDKIIFLGNFNARFNLFYFGKSKKFNNYKLCKRTIDKNGIGKCNSYEILLLTNCTKHNVVITNTVF